MKKINFKVSVGNKGDWLVVIFACLMIALGVYFAKGSLAAIGLALDIAGVCLLWRFGLPSPFDSHGIVSTTVWDAEVTPEAENRYKLAYLLSHAAIVLIVVGFAFQYFATVKSL
jgi:hypothetical protein